MKITFSEDELRDIIRTHCKDTVMTGMDEVNSILKIELCQSGSVSGLAKEIADNIEEWQAEAGHQAQIQQNPDAGIDDLTDNIQKAVNTHWSGILCVVEIGIPEPEGPTPSNYPDHDFEPMSAFASQGGSDTGAQLKSVTPNDTING